MRSALFLILVISGNLASAEYVAEHLCGTWKEVWSSPKAINPAHPDAQPLAAEAPKDAPEHLFTSKDWKVTRDGKSTTNPFQGGTETEEKRELFTIGKMSTLPNKAIRCDYVAVKLSADFKAATIIQNSGTIKLVKVSSDEAEAKALNEIIKTVALQSQKALERAKEREKEREKNKK